MDLEASGRSIVDDNLYMVLATADADGRPWASPVYFASEDYTEFYWVSSPEVTHSRNLAARSELSIVVFDSQAPISTGRTGAGYRDLLEPGAGTRRPGMDGGGRDRARAAAALSRDGVRALHARQERRGAAVRPPHAGAAHARRLSGISACSRVPLARRAVERERAVERGDAVG